MFEKMEILRQIRSVEAIGAAKRTYQQYQQLIKQPVTPKEHITAEMLQELETKIRGWDKCKNQ